MHARRKGKSGSKKPLATSPPSWMSYKPTEVEAIVIKLAKQSKSTSTIGLILRDKYGIADIKAELPNGVLELGMILALGKPQII